MSRTYEHYMLLGSENQKKCPPFCLCEFQLSHHSTQAKKGGVLMVHTIRNIQLLAREFNDASLTNALKSQFCFPIYVN